MSSARQPPIVGLIMGSKSDWETLKTAAEQLDALGVAYEAKVVSAHRTPKRLYDYATSAKSRGLKVVIAAAGGAAHLPGMTAALKVVIAAAGGAAHLPGMTAALTPLPVLGVPVKSKELKGLDSLLSIVQMPKGVPVATFAIGEAGAVNAALFAAALLALEDETLAAKLDAFRAAQTEAVSEEP